MSVPKVAVKYEIHRTTVLAHLERAGVPRRATPPALSEPQIESAVERHEAGDSYAAIARSFGVHAETVRRWVNRRA